MANTIDTMFIKQALQIAQQSGEQGNDAFGAILVKDGKLVTKTTDKCIPNCDPTAHAELTLISEFCRDNQVISLEEYTLYTSTEPCIMCAGAIHWAKIKKVVFSVSQHRLQTISGGKPKPSCADLINSGNKKVAIVGAVFEEEGLAILKKFPFVSKQDRIAKRK